MPTLQDLLQKADSYKERIASQPLEKEERKTLDDYFCIGITYSSNALDGDAPTTSVIKIPLGDGSGVEERENECLEAVVHDAAYDFMLELASQQDMAITEETIKSLHRLFYQKVDADQAGQYRTVSACISGTEDVAPPPEEVPRLVKHLAEQIHFSQSTLHPIELAAMAHKRLVDIHPFTFGNCSIAQLLMNLILVNAGYGVVSISPTWQSDYANALSDSRQSNDMEPFSKLIAQCVIEAEGDYWRLLKL